MIQFPANVSRGGNADADSVGVGSFWKLTMAFHSPPNWLEQNDAKKRFLFSVNGLPVVFEGITTSSHNYALKTNTKTNAMKH